MNDSNRQNWKAQAERLLLSLRDIVGANLSLDEAGDIVEVSILAEGHRPPKQIVRDVRSALRAEFQLDIDYRKISVAQKRTADGGAPVSPSAEPGPTRPTVLNLPSSRVQEQPAGSRLEFGGVTVTIGQNQVGVRVALSLGEREAVGEASGINSRQQVPRLTAEATLEAVSRFLDETYTLTLGDLEILNLAGDEVAVVTVKFFKERLEKTLSGACVVSHDLQQSIVYATLDSLNRILGRLRYKEPVEFELRPTTMS